MATAKRKTEVVKKFVRQQKMCFAMHCKPPSHSSVHLCVHCCFLLFFIINTSQPPWETIGVQEPRNSSISSVPKTKTRTSQANSGGFVLNASSVWMRAFSHQHLLASGQIVGISTVGTNWHLLLQTSTTGRLGFQASRAEQGHKMWRQPRAGHWLDKGFDETWDRSHPSQPEWPIFKCPTCRILHFQILKT